MSGQVVTGLWKFVLHERNYVRSDEREERVMGFFPNDQFAVLANDGFDSVLANERFLHVLPIDSSKTFCGNDRLLPCPTTVIHVPYCQRQRRNTQITRKNLFPIVEYRAPRSEVLS